MNTPHATLIPPPESGPVASPADGRAGAALELSVQGMHCAGCVGNVEAALRRVAGVRDARVNLATERAVVTWADGGPGPSAEALLSAVASAGYTAAPVVSAQAALAERVERRAADLRRRRTRLIAAALLGLPVIAGHFGGHSLVHAAGLSMQAWALLQAAIALGVIGLAAGDMIAGALRALLARSANMDLLVALGALTAYAAGWLAIFTDAAELLMFDAAALIVLFVALGKYIEALSRGRASAALESLFTRLPAEATRLIDGEPHVVPTETLRAGHRIRLAAHGLVPVDARVESGVLVIDESLLTGEALPVRRGPGQAIFGGARVVDGSGAALVVAPAATSTVARIAQLVEAAQASKAPLQRLADRAAAVFVPIVITLALLTFAGWLAAGGEAFWALQRAIAVLVIACPCAMGLAVPMAVLVGTTRAAQQGILIRDVEALEAAGRASDVLLDKTGTLTEGRPRLAALSVAPGFDERTVLALAAAAEQSSEHPLGRALVARARERLIGIPEASELRSAPGSGLAATVAGRRVVIGTRAWLVEQGVPLPPLAEGAGAGEKTAGETAAGEESARAAPRRDELTRAAPTGEALAGESPAGSAAPAAPGGSAVWLALDGALAAEFRFHDPPHPEAAAAVQELRALGLRLRVLSGDAASAVAAVAGALGISDFSGGMRPPDKLAAVQRLRAAGAVVAMVGDGINDAPALAAADVGIAIGAGADVAREAAAVCLVGHSPALLPRVVALSRATGRNMRQNLAWAVGYNVLMLPAAMFTPIPAAYATAAMMFSSLSVVWNALRLRRA